ncbi:MAG: Nif3-like dinuclear metal center hexameric protein [Candidatus Stygibacter frigidus]|nr:Nif3-like dinuclear metal center hexameric protein [Candidatus Stygibacter frigidus]
MPRKITTSDLIKIIHDCAPPALAYDWDNVGFLLGDASTEITKVLLCLDITHKSVDEAIRIGANLIISHHPLIFKPIRKITNPLYIKLIRNNISVISAHTNLDIAPGGVNTQLAELFHLTDLESLSTSIGSELYQVSVYILPSNQETLSQALINNGARHLHFSQIEAEIKLEFFCDSFKLSKIIATIHKYHPSPDPVYAVNPQNRVNDVYGMGVIGLLPAPLTIADFALKVKKVLSSPFVRVWLANKNPDTLIQKIAVCGGSGSSMISSASNRADVFLSGEFGYHSRLDSPIPLIEAGHFHTEFPVLKYLKKILDFAKIPAQIFPITSHETTTSTLYL